MMRYAVMAVTIGSLATVAACGSTTSERASGGGAAGAATGAGIGALAGPPGIVVGALVGGGAGAATGAATNPQTRIPTPSGNNTHSVPVHRQIPERHGGPAERPEPASGRKGSELLTRR